MRKGSVKRKMVWVLCSVAVPVVAVIIFFYFHIRQQEMNFNEMYKDI